MKLKYQESALIYRNLATLLSVSCQVRAKFGACTGAGLNGTLVEAYINVHSHPRMYAFYLEQSAPFRPTTVQMPNLALGETKRLTVVCFGKESFLSIF